MRNTKRIGIINVVDGKYNKFKIKDSNKNLHPSQREDAVEFILAGLDRSGVHECIIELKRHRSNKVTERDLQRHEKK